MTLDDLRIGACEVLTDLGVSEWPILWLIGLAGAVWGGWGVAKVFLKPPHKTVLYTGGVTDRGITLIKLLFLMAGVEAVAGIVSALAGWPLLWDLALLAVLFGLGAGIWWLLNKGKKFKPTKIAAVVFSPLGLGAAGAIPATVKVADQAPALVKTVANTPAGDAVAAAASRAGRFVDDVVGIISQTVLGKMWFRNTHVMGGLGDAVVARIYTARGYEKLPSKFSTVHGIDGVFVRRDGEKLLELVVVENKVNGSRLADGQMTQQWLLGACKKMERAGDGPVASTGRLVRQSLSSDSGVVVRRHLVRVNLETGSCTAKALDESGSVMEEAWSGNYTKTISDVLSNAVENGKCKLLESVVGAAAAFTPVGRRWARSAKPFSLPLTPAA